MRVSFAPEKVLSFSFCFSSVCVFDIFCAGQKTAARPPPLLQIQQCVWSQETGPLTYICTYICLYVCMYVCTSNFMYVHCIGMYV